MTIAQPITTPPLDALFNAVRGLDPIIVRDVVERSLGVSVNAMMPNAPGHAALHVLCTEAVKRYRRVDITARPSAEPRLQDDAAARCAKVLISAGAAVNARNADGQTPLMIAITSLNQPLIEALLEAGARPDIGAPSMLANAPENAFHIAAREGDARIMRMLLRTAYAEGAELSCGNDGTPLEVASAMGRIDVVAVILDHHLMMKHVNKASTMVDIPPGLGQDGAAMWVAAAHGQTEVVRYLARQGADVIAGNESILLYLAKHGGQGAEHAITVLVTSPHIKTALTRLLMRDAEHAGEIQRAIEPRDMAPLLSKLQSVLRIQDDTFAAGAERRRSGAGMAAN